MSRALTMDEAADSLRIGRRSFQEIVKRYPFYYANGRRKLFTEADIEKLRACIGAQVEASPLDVLRNVFVSMVSVHHVDDVIRTLSSEFSGFIYIVLCNDRVKIGYTGHLGNRLRVLKTACPYPLEVIATLPGDRNLEQVIHLAAADYRRHGEWFEHTGLVAEIVSRMRALK